VALLYVYAFTDTPLEAWSEGDSTIESVVVDGVVAICERRATSPPIAETELRRQHSIVLQIAERVPALLPARFGSLVDEAELASIVRGRMEMFRTALERVRGRAQMTLRISVKKRPKPSAGRAESGRAYLQQRLSQASVAVPPRARVALDHLSRFVLEERRTTNDGEATVYQLVERADAQKYLKAFERVRVPGMRVTGPWPPFAFVPDLWP
jgi:hypothetical protein